MLNQTTAIIFDCDGVLVDSEQISISVDRLFLRSIGLEYSEQDLSKLIGLSEDQYYTRINNDYSKLGKDSLPTEFIAQIRTERWRRYESELTEVHGASDFLQMNKRKVAVASSSSYKSIVKKLKLAHLHNYLAPNIFSTEQVRRGKPYPDIYYYSAAKIGVDPKNCVVIEDSVNGVKAATKSGSSVWGFTAGSHATVDLEMRLKTAGASLIISSFKDLSDKLNHPYYSP